MRALPCLLLLMPTLAVAASPSAADFARDALIVDTHIDAPSELLKSWRDLCNETPDREFDSPKAHEGGLDVAFMSIYTSPEDDAAGTARQKAHMEIDAVEAMAARCPQSFATITTPGDYLQLRDPGAACCSRWAWRTARRSATTSRNWKCSATAASATSRSRTATAIGSRTVRTRWIVRGTG